MLLSWTGEQLVRLLVEQVVRRSLGGALILGARGLLRRGKVHRRPQVREGVDVGVGVRSGSRGLGDALLVRRDDARLQVVEVELGRLPDLVDGLLGVLNVGKPYLDTGGADSRDLRLRHAELVGSGSDDVDRAVYVGATRIGDLLRPARLVDELRPALEVQAEHSRLRCDHEPRRDQQPEDQQDDESVSASATHRPRTSSGYFAPRPLRARLRSDPALSRPKTTAA